MIYVYTWCVGMYMSLVLGRFKHHLYVQSIDFTTVIHKYACVCVCMYISLVSLLLLSELARTYTIRIHLYTHKHELKWESLVSPILNYGSDSWSRV